MGIEKMNVRGGNAVTDGQTAIIQNRNRTLDVYKGVLIVLVVLRHVLQYSVADEGGILTNFIWAVQMPGFMLVAGYFAARKIDSLQYAGKRILLSAQHYALPFLSWFLLIEVMLLGKNGRNPITGLTHLLNHVDSGLWFLWVVFALSIVSVLMNLALFSKRGKVIKAGAVFVACFGVLALIGKLVSLNFLGIKYILYYAIFYGFGWLVKWTENWWRKSAQKFENTVAFLCLIVFLGIVFNFDLYHTSDGVMSIAARVIAGFTGNVIILVICSKYEPILRRIKLDKLGMYTLEVYATHMCVNNLMEMGQGFFTAVGFGNFTCSLILTVVFTTVIIATFKAIPAADFIFYGKRQKKHKQKS